MVRRTRHALRQAPAGRRAGVTALAGLLLLTLFATGSTGLSLGISVGIRDDLGAGLAVVRRRDHARERSGRSAPPRRTTPCNVTCTSAPTAPPIPGEVSAPGRRQPLLLPLAGPGGDGRHHRPGHPAVGGTTGTTRCQEQLHRPHAYWNTDRNPPGYASYVVPPLGGGGDLFYDDNAIVGLEFVRQYLRQHKASDRVRAEQIFDVLVARLGHRRLASVPGWDGWVDASWTSIRAANVTGLTTELAAHLYEITAKAVVISTGRTGSTLEPHCLRSPEGLYWNDIGPDGTVNPTLWIYNSGAMIGAGSLLYRATGDRDYLEDAERRTPRRLSTYWTAETGTSTSRPSSTPSFSRTCSCWTRWRPIRVTGPGRGDVCRAHLGPQPRSRARPVPLPAFGWRAVRPVVPAGDTGAVRDDPDVRTAWVEGTRLPVRGLTHRARARPASAPRPLCPGLRTRSRWHVTRVPP